MSEFPELKRNEFEAFLLQFSKPGSLNSAITNGSG